LPLCPPSFDPDPSRQPGPFSGGHVMRLRTTHRNGSTTWTAGSGTHELTSRAPPDTVVCGSPPAPRTSCLVAGVIVQGTGAALRSFFWGALQTSPISCVRLSFSQDCPSHLRGASGTPRLLARASPASSAGRAHADPSSGSPRSYLARSPRWTSVFSRACTSNSDARARSSHARRPQCGTSARRCPAYLADFSHQRETEDLADATANAHTTQASCSYDQHVP